MVIKKIASVFLVLALLCALSVPAFAVDSDEDEHNTNFIKALFVPSDNYFQNKIQVLNEKVNAKLGGVAYLYNMLDSFFKTLSSGAPNTDLKFSVPNNYLYSGYKGFDFDFLYSAKPYIKLLKDVLTAACYLLTGIICYHKLRTFFSASG